MFGRRRSGCGCNPIWMAVGALLLFLLWFYSLAPVHHISFPGPTTQTFTYVAIVDSFSSGEGNPPFITAPGYDTATEGCHRSVKAFPAILGRTASLHLMLSFVACSGATTHQVLGSMNTETSQL